MSNFILKKIKNKKGYILIIALIVVVAVTLVAGIYLSTTSTERILSVKDYHEKQAFCLAEAGLDKAIWYLIDGHSAPDGSTDGSWRTTTAAADLSSDASSGQKQVVVDGAGLFSENGAVRIKDDNNEEINTVSSIAGNTLTMQNNLQYPYTTAANAKVERGSAANLSSDASSGQKQVVVDDGSLFSENAVRIKDDNNEEINTVSSIAGNTLTMQNNLQNTYTTAANAIVDPSYQMWVQPPVQPPGGFSIFGDVWNYRKKITINAGKVEGSSSYSYFPVLINTTDTEWKEDDTYGGHVAQSDGGDILFTNSSGTKLDHEIEKYTPSTGELIAWVEITTLSNSVDTVIYIYYGNATCADQWDVEHTWDEGTDASPANHYKMVQHLQETPQGTVYDSTSNDNDSVSNNADPTTSGQVDGAYDFNGSDDYVDVGSDSSLDLGSGEITIESWIYVSSTGGWYIIAAKDNHNAGYQSYFYVSDGKIGATNGFLTTDTYYNQWVHAVVVSTGSVVTIYANGEVAKTGNNSNFKFHDDETLLIGARHNNSGGGSTDFFNGTIDEVRISDTTRDGDWIKTCYNNQSDPSSFYRVSVTIYARGTVRGVSRIIKQVY